MKNIILFAVIILAFGNSAISGNTYYVSNSGNNANAGSSAQPFKTITYAYSKVSAGDVIIVKPGVYTDYTPYAGLNFNKNGTATNPITIKSEYKWQAVIDGGNVSDHIECITLSGNYHIIQGFDIRGAFECGVWIKGTATGNKILKNNIHHCGNIGDPSSAAGQTGLLSDENTDGTQYYSNYIHHNGRFSLNSNLDHGMYLTGDNEVVVNNIVTHNCAYGIHIAGYSTVSNMKVYNNVFAWNGRSGGMVWMDMAGVDFRNNIFYKNAELGLLCYDAHGTGVIIDYNLWYGNPQGTINMTWASSDVAYTSGNNLINTLPDFVNDTSDYHIKSNSLAVDAGTSLASFVVDDFDGNVRAQGNGYDMGAYEFTLNPTGMFEEENSILVNIFPNPTVDWITISSETGVYDIEIINSFGETVLFSKVNSKIHTINISDLPRAVYFVKIADGSGVNTTKILLR